MEDKSVNNVQSPVCCLDDTKDCIDCEGCIGCLEVPIDWLKDERDGDKEE